MLIWRCCASVLSEDWEKEWQLSILNFYDLICPPCRVGWSLLAARDNFAKYPASSHYKSKEPPQRTMMHSLNPEFTARKRMASCEEREKAQESRVNKDTNDLRFIWGSRWAVHSLAVHSLVVHLIIFASSVLTGSALTGSALTSSALTGSVLTLYSLVVHSLIVHSLAAHPLAVHSLAAYW
jgi:hypothetical protein